jgi:prepilin-type N-terminal cleavage/methylation domain-containing protein
MRFIHTRSRSGSRARRGLSLPELMISMSITVMLLTATGAAFSASASAVEMNDRFFRASQAARVTVNQLLTEIRRCDKVDVADAIMEVTRPLEDRGPMEARRRYEYDAVNKRVTIQIIKTDETRGPLYTLASNVAAAKFGEPEMVKGENEAWIVVRVPISLTTQIGSNEVMINGAAAPRRSQKY